MDLNIKTDWNKEDYYNASDLNRVEHNTLVVANMLEDIIGVAISLEATLDRDYSSLEFANDMNRIENNIELLNVLDNIQWQKMKTSWKPGDPFNYLDAIRLEINIKNLCDSLSNNSNYIIYCGEINCGEGGL